MQSHGYKRLAAKPSNDEGLLSWLNEVTVEYLAVAISSCQVPKAQCSEYWPECVASSHQQPLPSRYTTTLAAGGSIEARLFDRDVSSASCTKPSQLAVYRD
ncbi:hypothetical protein XA68_13856 [Ophiocordyceps unilateralis]|uniref:Uncharacterized protein n=1 Tax=Ophiocordyceps unilateralis TaxID=268505 RepID=A0A2A9PBP0_OPHUN|nr:hypothetical protein XA68_13856 [Ophiocordyceps unilateralis]